MYSSSLRLSELESDSVLHLENWLSFLWSSTLRKANQKTRIHLDWDQVDHIGCSPMRTLSYLTSCRAYVYHRMRAEWPDDTQISCRVRWPFRCLSRHTIRAHFYPTWTALLCSWLHLHGQDLLTQASQSGFQSESYVKFQTVLCHSWSFASQDCNEYHFLPFRRLELDP